VKLYAPEPGHLDVSGLTGLTISALARVEVPAALWRKQRMDELTAQAAATLAARFAHDYAGGGPRAARFAIVPATARLLDAAAQLVASAGLRAYDGIQLAAAIAARGADPHLDAFACFDVDLRHAASVHGFALHPATM
jgi:predicted nucleic acid-binding protein